MKFVTLLIGKIKSSLNKGKKILSKGKKKALGFIDRRPYESFFVFLGVFLVLIVISNILGTPKVEEKKAISQVKHVKAYTIGSAPKLTVQAQVEKSGVITITSLMSGVVQKIYKNPGEDVKKGHWLVGLSTNYQGGNSFSVQRQLAEKQYQNILETFDSQKNIIHKQKDIASKSETMASDLRNISEQSIGSIQNLISLNNAILNTLQSDINTLSQNTASNSALILATQMLQSQFLSANNQANSLLLSTQYQASDSSPPAELATIQRDVAVKQLEVQEKMLDLNREVSRLQLQLARISEGLMFPTSPINATVQRVFVKVGQQVNPGDKLMVLSEVVEEDPAIAIAYVSQDIARKISRLEPSTLYIDNKAISIYPSYVTADAIQGSLYGVYFAIPDEYVRDVAEKGFIQVDLPIGYFNTSSAIPYIPVDAIYQTQDQSYVYVVKNGKAEARLVELGKVYGSFVEIEKGLKNEDKVILDRNVISGDTVKIIQ